MDKFLFHIIPNCFQDASGHDSKIYDFLIEEDNWNNYGYYTTYHIHATSKTTGKGTRYLGSMNFMHKGQRENESKVLTSLYYKKNMTFSQFDADYCSLSFSIELFSFLAKKYEKEDRLLFQKSLNLIISSESQIYEKFKDEPCFNESFLRFDDMNSFALKKGRQLLLGEGVFYELEKQKTRIDYKKSKVNIDLDFSGIDSVNDK